MHLVTFKSITIYVIITSLSRCIEKYCFRKIWVLKTMYQFFPRYIYQWSCLNTVLLADHQSQQKQQTNNSYACNIQLTDNNSLNNTASCSDASTMCTQSLDINKSELSDKASVALLQNNFDASRNVNYSL